MGIWPFGRRKTHRRNAQPGGGVSSGDPEATHNGREARNLGTYNGGEVSISGPERRQSRRDKKRKSSRDAKKLQKDAGRTYSFSPGRNDSIRVTGTHDQDRPPVPPVPIDYKGKATRAQTGFDTSQQGGDRLLRASTQPEQPSHWERMPTLHKKSPAEVARRKSSKRKKEDHDREAEIRAMTAFMPTRPAAEEGSSGRLLKRASRRMRGGLESHSKSSDISLPLAGSIHSSLSGSDHPASYKLSAFDMLSPRPTIKYADYPRYQSPSERAGVERSGSKKRRISERVSVPEGTLKPNKRINELADDLDAGELRELMERDQKRREKKRMAERIQVERRIARRQEKQKAEEARAAREGTPPPANLERGVMGRDVLGIDTGTSAVVTSSKRKSSSDSEGHRRPLDQFEKDSTNSSLHSPGLEVPTPASDRSDPIIETAKVGRMSRASMSPPSSPKGHARGASNISEMIDQAKADTLKVAAPTPVEKPQEEEEAILQPVSESESRRESQSQQRSSWTSFFRRRSKQIQRGPTPSSFSNTSRDSMLSAQQSGPLIGYTPMKSNSNIPKRTMSKFREDLPELPISPPDSRVQSPETDAVPPIQTNFQEKKSGHRSSTDEPRVRYDTPTSGYRSLDAVRMRDETPTSGHRSLDVPSPDQAVLSQSLASIDSEGSWLSGRQSKRGSLQNPTYAARDSAHSLQKRFRQYSDASEELGIAEDEYFSRLSPEPEVQRSRRISGNPMPSSDEEDGGMASPTPSDRPPTKWGAVGRTPTVVHRQARHKSREGLLNDFQFDSADDLTPSVAGDIRQSYGFDNEAEGEGLQRAKSVDLVRGHAKRISAGSARLLDMKPRDSTDSKRASEV